MPSSRSFGTTLVVIYIFLEVQGSHRGTIFLGQSLHIYFSHKGQRQNNFAILFVLQSFLPYDHKMFAFCITIPAGAQSDKFLHHI